MLVSWSVNLSWKIAVQNAGCVFANFYGWHKNNFWLLKFHSFVKVSIIQKLVLFFIFGVLKSASLGTLFAIAYQPPSKVSTVKWGDFDKQGDFDNCCCFIKTDT